MQICKVYKRWLRIFLTIKSPGEWVITKQASKDESIVPWFLPYLSVHRTLLRRVEHCTKGKYRNTNIYIYIPIETFQGLITMKKMMFEE